VALLFIIVASSSFFSLMFFFKFLVIFFPRVDCTKIDIIWRDHEEANFKKKSIWETGVRGLLTLHINHNHPNTHCQRSSLTHFFIKTYKFNYYSLFRLVQSSGRVAACRTILEFSLESRVTVLYWLILINSQSSWDQNKNPLKYI